MEGAQEAQNGQRGRWEQYAHCKNMSRFGNLASPEGNHRPFVKVENRVAQKEEEKQDTTSLPSANESGCPRSPAEQTPTRNPDLTVPNSSATPRISFGEPSPPRCNIKTPLWARGTPEMTEGAPRAERSAERSLEDLYDEHPEMKLQGGIESGTLSFAADVVNQTVTEAAYRWLNKWCPHMSLQGIFEAMYIENKEPEPSGKKIKVPLQAVDTAILKTSLIEMYLKCVNMHAKDSKEDIGFPKLIEMIDHGVAFMGAIRDSTLKALLQETRSTFQLIPLGIDAKKEAILRGAKAELKDLNKKYKNYKADDEVDSEALGQKRREEEVEILDAAGKRFSFDCALFEHEVLGQLQTLLAATPNPRQQPDLLKTN
ncbi:hypothetical protein EKO27_g1017 [Xylaria grammica]|uniref:Uncharacterized protein n=1 Tax=Xylaria grammica TaxID=363999 RepID=A0A439DI49_9PEZI|nr:hypothetical protein EKO27_g1017 [Xylaria grammica]